jgi:hypothetical protein
MKTFFVLALGRSGTAFLAALLGRDRKAVVHHEPYRLDHHLPFLRRAGVFDTVVDGLLEQRFTTLHRGIDPSVYGEVNSYLRYEVDWLRRRFDPALVHLVRDGRDFVRSAYIRDVYSPTESEPPIVPKNGDPYATRWTDMTRFERLCWYWMRTNEELAEKIPAPVRLEDVVRSYPYFEERVLGPTGVQVPRAIWESERDKPRNTSREYQMRELVLAAIRLRKRERRIEPLPHWTRWDRTQTDAFWRICGATMEKLGYRR